MEQFNWANQASRDFMDNGYLHNQTIEERVADISKSFERNLMRMGFPTMEAHTYGQLFFKYMAAGFYSLASPIWTNYGNRRGYPVSCFGAVPEDSMIGIGYTVFEAMQLMKGGGGHSLSLDNIRPRGSDIQNGANGKTSGSVHFCELFNELTNTVSQGQTRRGFISPYLHVDHDDILEFLTIGDEGHPIQFMKTGVVVSNKFLDAAAAGDAKARKILVEIHRSRSEKGYPYILFEDNANDAMPQPYKDAGLRIRASNMCVAPETMVLTDKGQQPIHSMQGSFVNVWNGKEWSEVEVVKTGENQKLLKVTLSTGQELECTEYHKWYLRDGKEVRTVELAAGDKLMKFDLPIVSGESNLKDAYAQGFFSGDGCHVGNNKRIYLYGDKQELLPMFSPSSTLYVQPENNRTYFNVELDNDKSFVPTGLYRVQDKVEWLAGLLDSDGTVLNNNGSLQFQISSVNKDFLRTVQLLLQELGCKSSLRSVRESGIYMLPANDGSGEPKPYECKEIYRLNISTYAVGTLLHLGLDTFRLDTSAFKQANREASRFSEVVSVEDLGRYDDTFCFTESKRHMGMFNGILTGQCSEIMLPSDEENSFVCVLSSINLVEYDNWKDTDAVEVMQLFLDTVVQEFIWKLEEEGARDAGSPLARVLRFTEEHRATGMGVLGWHHLLQSKNIPYEAAEAFKLDAEISKTIAERSDAMSKYLGEQYGEPKYGGGFRNATRRAIAPTKSSSFILNQVSQGIEPELANIYIKKVAKNKVVIKNPYLQNLLADMGKDTEEVWDDIAIHAGSVQHLDFLTDHQKLVFKTLHEIPPKVQIDQTAMRQPYYCQGISLNLPIAPDVPLKEINALLYHARDMGVKSLYYQYSMNAAQMLSRERAAQVDCAMCEA